jgi:hypothetical protein
MRNINGSFVTRIKNIAKYSFHADAILSYILQIIQFNSVRVYLRANLTAQRPITKFARVCRKTQT